MTKRTRFNLWYWIAAFIGILLIEHLIVGAQRVANIPYSQFQELSRAGQMRPMTCDA